MSAASSLPSSSARAAWAAPICALAREIVEAAARRPRDHRRRRHHAPRRSADARPDRRRRSGRHGALHRQARSRRCHHGAAGQRPARWPVATVVVDERGRGAGPRLFLARVDPRGGATRRRASTSRAARGLWIKGETSGAIQELLAIDLDCDRDSLRFIVRQPAPASAISTPGPAGARTRASGASPRLLAARRANRAGGLLHGAAVRRPGAARRQAARGGEELTEAQRRDHVVHEAADVLYFTLARLAREGIGLDEVEAHLDRRHRRVTRRD